MVEKQLSKIQKRFIDVRRHFALGQVDFAVKAKIKQSQVSEIENGKRNITAAIILSLEDNFGVNRHWLETGEGEMLKKTNPRLEAVPTRLYADPLDHENRNEKIIYLPDGTIAMRVPIVPARAYAGYMTGFADPEYYDDLEDILIGVDKEPGGTYIGFEVVGKSMICLDTEELAEQSIFPGRIAIGRELPPEHWKTRLHTHNYKNWIFVHKTEGILIKQIAKHDVDNGIITIHSLNPDYQDEDLKLSDMQQIFSVLEIVQRTRTKLK
jgi:phage repressor protein C with HTH and peptisase S24 domain